MGGFKCVFILFLFVKSTTLVRAVSHMCATGKLSVIDTCTTPDGRMFVPEDGTLAVSRGSVCTFLLCGVLTHAECSIAGRWVTLEGKEVLGSNSCVKNYHIEKPRKLKRMKKFIFGRRRSPPPPPPPPPNCGTPSYNQYRMSVSFTSTTQGAVATYGCHSGYRHTAGSSTRTCQSNSQWSGTEPTCTKYNSCNSGPCMNSGSCTNIPEDYTCTCDVIWKGRNCEEVAYVCARNPCSVEGTERCEDGANMYTCVCKPGWYDATCQTPVDCGHPGDVTSCDLEMTGTTLANYVNYVCYHDYNMTSGDGRRECLASGIWSGSSPTCTFANSCKSSPCVNSYGCVNLLDDFSCECLPGWSGKTCDTDIQPPLLSNCPTTLNVNATETTKEVEWTAPDFSDPFGNPVDIATNYGSPKFTFPWGDFTISYTGTKVNNGLSVGCTFNISIRPTPCEPLLPPVNGMLLCNDWDTDYGQLCYVACRRNYTIPLSESYSTWFVCGASGQWSPGNQVPDCSLPLRDEDVILTYQQEYDQHVFETCTDGDGSLAEMKNTYVSKMQQDPHISKFCTRFPDGCDAVNVRSTCS